MVSYSLYYNGGNMEKLFSNNFAKNIFGKISSELASDNFEICEHDIYQTLFMYRDSLDVILSKNIAADFITAINGELTPELRQDMLVSDSDLNLDEYISRLEESLRGNDWCIAYFGLHTANSIMWDKLKEFADKLSLSLGYKPAGRVDIDLFIGKYKSTHSGIHYDNAHNFAITLRGNKKMYTWGKGYEHLNGLKYPDYEEYKKDSVVLNNVVDRVCYFPHDAFHVAESSDSVSVVLNIAFWESSEKPKNILSFIKNNLVFEKNTREVIPYSGRYHMSDNTLIKQVSDLLENDSPLEKYIVQYELMQNTCSNLNISRPVDDYFPIEDDEIVSLKERCILQYHIDQEERIITLSSNGHAASIKFSNNALSLCKKLSNKYDIKVADYRDFIDVLNIIRKWGAI